MIVIRNWRKELSPEDYKKWEAKASAKWQEIKENSLVGVTVDPELASFMGLPLPREGDGGVKKKDVIRSWLGVEHNQKGEPVYVGTEENKKT